MDEDVPTLSLRKRNWRLNLTPSIIHMVNEYPHPQGSYQQCSRYIPLKVLHVWRLLPGASSGAARR